MRFVGKQTIHYLVLVRDSGGVFHGLVVPVRWSVVVVVVVVLHISHHTQRSGQLF